MSVLIDKHKCAIVYGILLLIVLIFVIGVCLPVRWKYNQYQEILEGEKNNVAQYAKIISKKPQLEAQLKEITQNQAQHIFHLTQATKSLAAADLQELVKNMVISNQGKLVSTQIINKDSGEKFPIISIKVQVKGTVESIQKVFYALETHQPYLFIDTVYMRAQRVYGGIRNRRRARRNSTPPGTLDVRFNLSGYMREGI